MGEGQEKKEFRRSQKAVIAKCIFRMEQVSNTYTRSTQQIDSSKQLLLYLGFRVFNRLPRSTEIAKQVKSRIWARQPRSDLLTSKTLSVCLKKIQSGIKLTTEPIIRTWLIFHLESLCPIQTCTFIVKKMYAFYSSICNETTYVYIGFLWLLFIYIGSALRILFTFYLWLLTF